jgi:phosphoribosyl-ATP pyrophosphohydrolase
MAVKTFDELYSELQSKRVHGDANSGTLHLLEQGVHAIGKKVVEEAAEAWMAAEYEGPQRTAEEISQLIYFIQVLMIATDVSLDDVYQCL